MAITPAGMTRVSHNLRTMTMLSSLRRNTVDIFQQQNRLATGRSFLSMSDDPAAASQSQKMNDSLSQQGQVLKNLQYADLMMSASDDALSEVNSLLNEAESIASQSIGAQASPAEREANAALIASIRERLMIVGNRTVNGSYIFAGRDTQDPPFVSALGGVAYLGDTGDVLSRVARFEQEAINVPGNLLFGALSSGVGESADLSTTLANDTRLEDLGGANQTGVRKGTLLVSSDSGTTVQVDLTNADTVGDVVDMFNAATTAAGINATLAVNGTSLSMSGSGVTIRDTPNGSTATDLGISTPSSDSTGSASATTSTAPPNLRPRMSPNTVLSTLRGGEGIAKDGGLLITNGNASAVIDLSDAKTIQDVTNRINAAGLNVVARINGSGTGIEVFSQVSGAALTISENGGTTAAEFGLLTMSETTPLSDLNFGRGVEILSGESDLRVTSRSGESFEVNLDSATTVGDVIELINAASSEAGVSIKAGLSQSGSGIMLSDSSGGDGPLSIGRATIESFAAEDLGLIQSVVDPEADLVGDNVGARRAEGIFTALVDLERNLAGNNERALVANTQDLVKFAKQATDVHGLVGARSAAFRERAEQTENAVIATESFLSEIQDLDYTEAVTRFQQAQTALQANLLSGSQLLNLSLLDFLS
jgi:flagellar hook-associated protein 3 FlgL